MPALTTETAVTEPENAESNTTSTTTESEPGTRTTESDKTVAPSAPPVDTEEKDPELLISQGKRCLVCGEILQAVNHLQEACRLLSNKYGETADECGDAYFLYGKALLELSRMESGVLGNALQGMTENEDSLVEDEFTEPDNLTEEQKEKISEEILDAMTEPEKKDEEEKCSEAEDKTDTEKTTSAATEQETVDEQKPEEKTSGEGETKTKDETEETKKTVQTSHEKTEIVSSEKQSDVDKTGESTAEQDKNKQDTVEVSEQKQDKSDDKADDVVADAKTDVPDVTDTNDKKETAEEESADVEDGEEEMDAENNDDDAGDDEDQDDNGDNMEDDVSHLQLAWEMLELSKNIFKRKDDSESKLKVADSILKLGEVSIESEQYAKAAEDLLECLNVQQSVLASDDRRLAETHYQLGLAYCYNEQYDQCADQHRLAADIIRANIQRLEKAKDEKTGGDSAEKAGLSSAEETELKELQDILADINNKIDDAEEEKRNIEKVKQVIHEKMDEMSSTVTGFGNNSEGEVKVAADVSHLVRKKRKPDAIIDAEDETKKQKTEEKTGDETKRQTSGDKTDDETKKETTGDKTNDTENKENQSAEANVDVTDNVMVDCKESIETEEAAMEGVQTATS